MAFEGLSDNGRNNVKPKCFFEDHWSKMNKGTHNYSLRNRTGEPCGVLECDNRMPYGAYLVRCLLLSPVRARSDKFGDIKSDLFVKTGCSRGNWRYQERSDLIFPVYG